MNQKPDTDVKSQVAPPSQGVSSAPRNVRIFLCYRRNDGAWYAEWLNQHLLGAEFSDSAGKRCRICTYYDKTAPGVADWKNLHFPSLQASQALIVVCTPGIATDLSRPDHPDWVYEELRWWVRNRGTPPIVIDATGEGDRWLPEIIGRKWPNINRIDLDKGQAETVAAREDARGLADRIVQRIVGAICESEHATVFEDLENQKRKTRQLRVALSVALLFFAASLAGSYIAFQNRKAALDAAQAADSSRRIALQREEDATNALAQLRMANMEADNQRNIAEKQKTLALDLFYSLTYKIPEALGKIPGNERIREGLVRDTIASLDKLHQVMPDASDVRRELATNHRLLGGILADAERYREAEEEFKASASFYTVLLEKEPNDDLFNRDLAVSLYNSGRMLERLRDRQSACREYVKSIMYARTAAELNQRWADELRDAEARVKALACPKT